MREFIGFCADLDSLHFHEGELSAESCTLAYLLRRSRLQEGKHLIFKRLPDGYPLSAGRT
jgi:hypothetical protein